MNAVNLPFLHRWQSLHWIKIYNVTVRLSVILSATRPRTWMSTSFGTARANLHQRYDATVERQSDWMQSYVPAEFREQLKSRPNISVLADACHVSDELYPSRQHKFDSQLHLITSAGKEGQSLTGHLVGDLVLLCKPLDKSKRRSGLQSCFQLLTISDLKRTLGQLRYSFDPCTFLSSR